MCADLYGMGGVHALISQLDRPEAEVRTAAFWALGTAAANNPAAQEHQLAAGLLPRVLSVLHAVHSSVTAGSEQEGVKALYALSGAAVLPAEKSSSLREKLSFSATFSLSFQLDADSARRDSGCVR